MRKEVGILDAKPLEDGLVAVGAAVTIAIAIKPDFGSVLHERAVARRHYTQRHCQAFGEYSGRGRSSGPGVVDHEHLVAAACGKQPPCGFGVLVGVDRVFQRRRRPEPAAGVEGQGHELAVGIARVFALREHEFGGEAVGEGEVASFILGRERSGGGRALGCRGS